MNTIAAQMPCLGRPSDTVKKDEALTKDKTNTFEDVLNGTKEQKDQDTAAGPETAEAEVPHAAVLMPGQQFMAALCFADAVRFLKEPVMQAESGKSGPDNVEAAEKQPDKMIQSQEPVKSVSGETGKQQIHTGETQQQVTTGESGTTVVNTEQPVKTAPAETAPAKTAAPENVMPETVTSGNAAAHTAAAETVDTKGLKQTPEDAKVTVTPELQVRDTMPADSTPRQEMHTEKPVTHKSDDIRPEYVEHLKSNIAKEIASGRQQFEIRLTPENLGTMVIKASYEAGKAVISIICSEANTMQVMSQQARELAQMVEVRTGSQTEVIVDKPPEDYTQQQSSQDGSGREENSDRRQEENKKADFQDSFDFQQQLRLGLA